MNTFFISKKTPPLWSAYTLRILILITKAVNLVEAELIAILRGRGDTNPVTEGVLLQVLASQVFNIALRERNGRSYGELLGITSKLDLVTELTSLPLDLNAAAEVVLESGWVEDTVASRAGVVDEELVLNASGGLLLLRGLFRV